MMRRLLPIVILSLLAGCANVPARKYVVFFSPNSATLDEAAQNVVTEAAQIAERYPAGILKIEGYAAAGKDLSADELLAIDRTKVVSKQLVSDGVAENRLRQQPRPTTGEDKSVAARRVEIEFVAP